MKILPGSYVKIMYDLKVGELDREISISNTKRKIREQTEDGKIEEKEILEYRIFKIGNNELPKFFEDTLLDMDLELQKDYEIEIPPEKAYGLRDPKKIEKLPLKTFRSRIDKNIFVLEDGSRRPAAGKIVYVNFGGNLIYYGRIIRVDSRAIIIDRNHPYAGKKIIAYFKLDRIVLPSADNSEKLDIILEKFFGETKNFLDTQIDENKLHITVKSDYYKKNPVIDRQSAEKVISELYVPKILLMTWSSNLYSDLGVTKIIWHEEAELLTSTPQTEQKTESSETSQVTEEKVTS